MFMAFSPRKKFLAGILSIAVIIGIGAGAWWYVRGSASVEPFPLNSADAIVSWTFAGAYAGNDTLVAQAQADRGKLQGLLGKGEYDDYDLYLGMGNDENLIGNGAAAYDDYNRAINIHPDKGLGYVNLGHLMDELGAYRTAADAYAKAVTVEPAVLQYHVQRLTFLTRQFADDASVIQAALKDASDQFGDTPAILAIKAEWLTARKHYADAIQVWETVKTLSPANRQAAIQTEIDRLQAKL